MIDVKSLLDYLKELDKKLERKILMIAVGGTAMVLMGLKESTKDVDLCAENKKGEESIIKANNKVKSDFKIDLWQGGYIFSQQLPEDYIKRARTFKSDLKNINLKLLSPIDVIITKVSRLNERDIEDIATIIHKKKINKNKLIGRFKIIKKTYPGSDSLLENNFRAVLNEFY